MTQPNGEHASLEELRNLKERALRNHERAAHALAEADADLNAITAAIQAVERSRGTARERAHKRWFPPTTITLTALTSALISTAHHARNHLLLTAATVTGGAALVTLPVTLPMMDASPDHHPYATTPAQPTPTWATRKPPRTRPRPSRTPTPSPSPTPTTTPTGTVSPSMSPPASPSPSTSGTAPQTPAPNTTTPPPSAPVQEQPPDEAAPPVAEPTEREASPEPDPPVGEPGAVVEVSLCRVNLSLPPLLRLRATC